jgi:hypothetical protein
MTANRPLNPFDPSGERREFAQLVGRIQTLTLELHGAIVLAYAAAPAERAPRTVASAGALSASSRPSL